MEQPPRAEEEDDLHGIEQCVQEIVDGVKDSTEMATLDTAITILRETIEEETDNEMCTSARLALVKALLVRYAHKGWPDDLYEALRYFALEENEDGRPDAVDCALQLIAEHQQSIDQSMLETAICIADETLDPCTEFTTDHAELLLCVGNALVLKYLGGGDIGDLDLARGRFLDVRRSCQGKGALASVALCNLIHAECIKFIEGDPTQRREVHAEIQRHTRIANEEDAEGVAAFQSGIQMMHSGDQAQLDESISQLRLSLSLRPPRHPRRLSSLVHLTIALQMRFESRNNRDDLEESIALGREALSLTPVGHPARCASLDNLVNSLSSRFDRTGNFQNLEESIVYHQEALSLIPKDSPGHSMMLNNLASSLSTRYQFKGNFEDLARSITLHKEVLDLRPKGDPRRFYSLTNLAIALATRFQTKGDIQDIEECVACHREVLTLTPEGHPIRLTPLNNLANSLLLRFEQKGDIDDLEESIKLHREALVLTPTGHPDHFMSLNNLALSLSARFQHKGDFGDLEESIGHHREALAAMPPSHPIRATSLNNLATSLHSRFDHKGETQDLEDCVRSHREALALRPPGSPDRVASLSNLANSLSARFLQKGDIQDLEESISHHREASLLLAPDHPGRSKFLNNFANSLYALFNQKGDFQTLEESIAYYREALDLRPEGHPEHLSSLSNLAVPLFARFTHKGDIQDLAECISYHQRVLEQRPKAHPDRSATLDSLATCLGTRFQRMGEFKDLDDSIAYQKEALALRPQGHPARCSTLNNVATSLTSRFEHRGDFQDLEDAIMCHTEALELRPAGHPERSSSLRNLGGSLSNRFRYKGVSQDLEESIRYQREALALTPKGHPDRSSSLIRLAVSLSTLFQHRKNLEDLEECIQYHREALELREGDHPERASSLNNLGVALYARFESQGDLKDLKDCVSYHGEALHTATAQTESQIHPQRWLGSALNLIIALRALYRKFREPGILDDILHHLKNRPQIEGTSFLLQMQFDMLCTEIGREFDRADVALEGYTRGLALLPLLASLDLTLEQRKNVLVHTKNLLRDAVQCAIAQGELETAAHFLSSSRSVFWSQALQFRASLERLESSHPELAAELDSVNRRLQVATRQTSMDDFEDSLVTPPAPNSVLQASPYVLSKEREVVLARIRQMEGFHDFLIPPSFQGLKAATAKGPIVFLNASYYGCDALIFKSDGSLEHLPLEVELDLLRSLKNAVQRLADGNTLHGEVQHDIDVAFEKRNLRLKARIGKRNRSVDDDFRRVLEILWELVVLPVVERLRLKKINSQDDNSQDDSDLRRRIWWCPTGPFAFLPVHAAGIYSSQGEGISCLSDYAVSSYCSSPQDLLAPPTKSGPDFKMFAVIEPEKLGPGMSSLPSATLELEKIKSQIPDQRRLTTLVGSKDNPTSTKSVIDEINTSSIVHFGCHGMQDLSNPLNSHLLLSGGQLTVEGLIRECQTSTPALAYLSACETAMGDEERPDESLTLAATMMFAGFRGVVGTMWSIHDQDAPIVANVFYQHLFRHGGSSPPDVTDAAYGLDRAVKELRDLGRPFHHWVPFVHFGV
ncbi:mucin-like protein 1 [Coprinopsis cinerea AmutBmut pab1-1]|nr:mucin-like protein 1 [Coprinopsis cinerea AmutBmut pab1-1]